MCGVEIRSKEVTTRKNNSCAWCGERIEKGERAQARTYRWDGELRSDHMHPECWEASGEVAKTEGCFEFNPGDYPRGSTDPY